MKHILICLGLLAGFFGIAHSIQTPEEVKKSEQIMLKMKQLDLLNQMIPLALTKEQIGKLLPSVERARAKVKQTQKEELNVLLKLESKLTDAIKTSTEKQIAPPKALIDEVSDETFKLAQKRGAIITENVDSVFKVFNDTLNAGQKKAAANSLAIAYFIPDADPKKMTDAEKIRVFIQEIFLDPQAYDVLLQLEKFAPSGGSK